MATVAECRVALDRLAEKMAANADEVKSKVVLDRALACNLRDLDASFHARLVDGGLRDIAEGDDPNAKIRLMIGSDDLIALVDGHLDFARAWASGRLAVKASFTDLLKLRNLL